MDFCYVVCARAARELTLEAAQSAALARISKLDDGGTQSLNVAHVKKLLDSRNEKEVLDGMRKVISVCDNASSTPCYDSDLLTLV